MVHWFYIFAFTSENMVLPCVALPVEMLVMLCKPLFAAYSVQVMKLVSDTEAEKGYCSP